MKLRGESDSVTVEALAEGDRITVSVSHNIRVDGDDSWVKYEVNTQVRQGETTDMAETRAVEHVAAAVIRTVHKTVDAIREATS